jgi:hypothetical protein
MGHIEYMQSKNEKVIELNIGFKYDHEAYRLKSKLNEVRIPRIAGMAEQREAEVIVNTTFGFIIQAKDAELRELAYGHHSISSHSSGKGRHYTNTNTVTSRAKDDRANGRYAPK